MCVLWGFFFGLLGVCRVRFRSRAAAVGAHLSEGDWFSGARARFPGRVSTLEETSSSDYVVML
jgi:hypothetical protein